MEHPADTDTRPQADPDLMRPPSAGAASVGSGCADAAHDGEGRDRHKEDGCVDLDLLLWPPGGAKAVACVQWCSPRGSKFRGTMTDDAHTPFGTIHELCCAAGLDPDIHFSGWTVGLARGPGSGICTGLSLAESDGHFDARALTARLAAFRVSSERMFGPRPPAPKPRATALSTFLVPEGSAITKQPVLRFVGSASKRADARRRATAASARSESAMPWSTPSTASGGSTTGTITTHVRVKGKRARVAPPSSRADAPPAPDYTSPVHMFTTWYDLLDNGENGCDHSVSASDAWSRMPAASDRKGDKWCRRYWERAYAKEAHRAYAKRSHCVVDSDGRRVRIDMPAPGVPVTPTADELAMAFYSDTKGGAVDPRDVVYGLWDQELLDRWFRRSTRWCTFDADPVLDAIVGRRWVMGNRALYLCAWARPEAGVNARRLVRPHVACASVARGEALAVATRGTEQRTSWHATIILCQNARYAAAVKAYEEQVRARAANAVEVFLDRMQLAGHGELIEMLRVEARIALYALGILEERVDGPVPKSPCVFAPGYCMTTRERLMSVVPPPPVRGPTTRPLARDPDARRAFDAIMGLDAKTNDGSVTALTPPAPDPMDEVRAQRRALVKKGVRVKRLIRREWARVERRNLLGDIEVDQPQDDDDDDGDDDDGGDDDGDDGDTDDAVARDRRRTERRMRKPKSHPFWSGIERRMRLLDLVEDPVG
nr:hypothetical protein [Pandoravirus belohorizontensis]